jgi:hypothetical protein
MSEDILHSDLQVMSAVLTLITKIKAHSHFVDIGEGNDQAV